MAEYFFENPDKVARAEEIIALLSGRPAKSDDERERTARFASLVASEKLDVVKNRDEALRYIYGKLGGLERTIEEHKKAEAVKEEVKKRKKK